MHDVQTVEEDILCDCWCYWYRVVEEDGDSLPSPSKFPMMVRSSIRAFHDWTLPKSDALRSACSQSEYVQADVSRVHVYKTDYNQQHCLAVQSLVSNTLKLTSSLCLSLCLIHGFNIGLALLVTLHTETAFTSALLEQGKHWLNDCGWLMICNALPDMTSNLSLFISFSPSAPLPQNSTRNWQTRC